MQTETIGDAVLETWDAAEVATAFEAGEIIIIDVRSPQEFMHESIEGALLMPMAFFRADALPGQTDKRIVFHCAGGVRSDKVARATIAAGFKAIAHMGGGFAAWKQAKQPYIATDMATGAPRRVG